tara:strand:+ start:299 stop:538 length:240 start_codon:yes stop_codon:yes gene_type:complete
MLSEYEEELLAPALAILGEHFPNYAIAVLTADDELLHSDYSSWRIGRMLFRDSLEEMESDANFDSDGVWTDCDDWDDED